MRWLALAVGAALVLVLAAPAGAHATHVSVAPQVTPDGTVYVGSAAVVDPVWLVLHADDGGAPGQPLGETFLDPSEGLRTDVPVSLPGSAWADMAGPRTLWVDLYLDDGDGRFDPSTDSRLSAAGLFTPQSVVVRRGERAYVGAGRERPQRTTGTVTVRRAILPADGYLVLRNVTGDGPGAVVGRAALPAGNHSDVAVDLDPEFYASRPSTFSLRVGLRIDDGDGAFDADDRPVRVGDTAVGSRLRVTKRADDATPTPAEAALVTTPTAGGDRSGSANRGKTPGVRALAIGLAAALLSLIVLLVVGRYRG